MTIPRRKGEPVVVDRDEHPRETSLEALARLPTPFRAGGTVTAGNASGVNDGAAALLVASGEPASARPDAAGAHRGGRPPPACRRGSWASARCRRRGSSWSGWAGASTRST